MASLLAAMITDEQTVRIASSHAFVTVVIGFVRLSYRCPSLLLRRFAELSARWGSS